MPASDSPRASLSCEQRSGRVSTRSGERPKQSLSHEPAGQDGAALAVGNHVGEVAEPERGRARDASHRGLEPRWHLEATIAEQRDQAIVAYPQDQDRALAPLEAGVVGDVLERDLIDQPAA